MNKLRQTLTRMALGTLIGLFATAGHAQASATKNASGAPAEALHDGQHDFDFELGTWKIHLKRLLHPLTGSNAWVEFDGTSMTRKVWDGRSQIEEFEVDSPSGHVEGLTLRLYSPLSRQWSLYWANSKNGSMGGPPTIGEFKNGTGEFFDQESINGRTIFVRYLWSQITPNSAHFEQSFSVDGGKTWEVNWITDQSRVDEGSLQAHAERSSSDAAETSSANNARDGQHDFDSLFGSWKYHLTRRVNPLTGSTSWVDFGGTGTCRKLWDGRANLDEAEFDGPSGHIEGLTLRLYNPQSHQWSLYWANSKDGILVTPQIGEFRNGVGEFYAQDTINGRTILIRFVWTNMASGTPHFEQSFSDDGGKTWETNWITDQTKVETESAKTH